MADEKEIEVPEDAEETPQRVLTITASLKVTDTDVRMLRNGLKEFLEEYVGVVEISEIDVDEVEVDAEE